MKRVSHYLLSPRNNRGRKEGVCLCSHNSLEIFAFRHFVILRGVRISAWELCHFKKVPKGADGRLRGSASVARVTVGPNLHAPLGNSGTLPPSLLSWENLHEGRIWVVAGGIAHTRPHGHERRMEGRSPALKRTLWGGWQLQESHPTSKESMSRCLL